MIQVKKRQALKPAQENIPPITSSSLKSQPLEQHQQEQSSNIKVIVRVRPLLQRETTDDDSNLSCLVDIPTTDPTQRTITLKASENSVQSKKYREPQQFQFNRCFSSFEGDIDSSHYATQSTIFNEIGNDMLMNSINGFNSCIMAYGQTGSGKTYTMMGTESEPGLIPTICGSIFDKLNGLQDTKYEITASFFEIYQENVIDLLNSQSKSNQKLKIRENSDKIPFVENLSEIKVDNHEDILKLLSKGFNNRTTAETHLNKQSSRSHSILTLGITQERFNTEDNSITKLKSNLRLVDLAGSEKSTASDGLDKVRQLEGTKINKSLTTLGRILTLLSERKTNQKIMVPYRESTLTWLLKDNIGGNSKTTMIACISPVDFDESLSTLRFATITSKIENQAKLNKESQIDIDELVKKYELEKLELLSYIAKLRSNANVETTIATDTNDIDYLVSLERDRDIKKLENYVKWQNQYIDTISFSNSFKIKKLSDTLKITKTSNEKLLNLLIFQYQQGQKQNEIDDPGAVAVNMVEESHILSHLDKLTSEITQLDILSVSEDIRRDVEEGKELMMKYGFEYSDIISDDEQEDN